jgi:RHS repeat-associated protein
VVVSAYPARLDECAGTYDRLDGDLLITHSWLASSLSSFVLENRWGSFDAFALVGNVAQWVAANGQDASWLRAVAQAFRDADARGAELCYATDTQIASALTRAGFPQLRSDLVVTPAAATGGATTTGYANDPVSAASGNLVEVEIDLGCGPALRWLQVRRTYNSRDAAVGPFGPGWSSWASTRLRRDPHRPVAHLRGPDGQVAEIPMEGGTGTVAGFPGRVEAPEVEGAAAPTVGSGGTGGGEGDGGGAGDDPFGEDERGLVARFPLDRLCWRFDPEGRPVEIDPGPGHRVALGWEGGRLVRLAHERGRSLGFTWVGERIVAAVADDGRRVDYCYDDDGRLVAVEGPMGARRYTWDEAGRLAAATDADGVVAVRTGYDRDGRVTAQDTAAGRTVRFTYRPDLVTEVGDDRGGPSNRWVHDEDGRLVQAVDGLGRATTTVHDEAGRRTRVIDRRGGTTSYVWDRAGRCRRIERPGGATVALDWDDRDRCTAVTGPGGATCRYGYTGDDRVPTTIEDPVGGVTHLEVVDGQVRRVVDADGVALRFAHDDEGRLVALTDGDGATLRYEWDAAGQLVAMTSPLGHRTSVERDPAGLVVARRLPDGGEWHVERSAAGRVVAVVDPTGGRQELRRGPDGEVVEDVDPTGAATRFEHDEHGATVAVTAPDGGRWTFGHDALLRPITVTDPAGATWPREYDPEGALVATVTPTGTRRAAAVDESGAVTRVDDGCTSVRFGYDAAGRAVRQTRPDGTTALAEHDAAGRLVAVTEPTGDVSRLEWTPAGRLAAVVAAGGARVVHRYDGLGRLAEVVDAEGGRRRLRYDRDGRVVERTGPTGETTAYAYDAAGRVVEVTAPDGGVTRHAYDLAGRPIARTGPDGGVTRWSYDAAGRIVAVTDPAGGVTRFERDPCGRVVAQVDPTGARWTLRLDARGNPVETTDPEGRTTRYGYDLAGRQIRRIDPDGTRHWWCWDDADRLTALGAGPIETRYTYDDLGRLARVDDSRGAVVTRTWDPAGRLAAETVALAGNADPAGAAVATWQRDPAGNVVEATLALPGREPATTRYHLDRCGRPALVHDPVVGTVTIERDAAGRPTTVARPAEDGTRVVERRRWAAGRLAGWDGPRDRGEVERDPAGRVVAVVRGGEGDGGGSRTRYGYDAAGQLVAVDGDHGRWRFTWDPAGRLVAEEAPHGDRRFTYDRAGRLTTIEGPGGTTHVEWDACGRRLAEHRPGGRERRFHWDALGRLTGVDVTDPDGATRSRRFDHDPLGRLAAVDGVPLRWDPTGPLDRLWAVGEHLLAPDGAHGAHGIASGADDPDAPDVLDPWAVRPAASPRGAHGLDGTAAGDGGAAGSFVLGVGRGPDPLDPGPDPTGPERPPVPAVGARGELVIDGLVWLGARVYDPATRSFLSPDPLPGLAGHPWTSHPYQYAANDPVGWADPTGLRPVTDAELAAIRDGWHDDAWDRYGGYVVGGLMVLGAAAVFMIPGIGPVASSMLVGALASGGLSAGVQQAVHGEVDWAHVAIDMVIGAGAGGLGFAAGGLRSVAAMSPLARGATVGVVESTVGGMTARATYGQDPFDPGAMALDVLSGGVAGGAGGHLGARSPGLEAATGATRWPGAHGTFGDPNVQAVVDDATGLAWQRSKPDLPFDRREQGGWIVGNEQTGAVRSVPVPPGFRTSLPDNPLPALAPGERVLAHYHTHPTPPEYALGTYPDGRPIRLSPAPSPADVAYSQHSGIPEVVRSRDHLWIYDPATNTTASRPIPPP